MTVTAPQRPEPSHLHPGATERSELDALREENARLTARVTALEIGVEKGEQRRRAMIHIMDDLSQINRRLSDQRRAMLHILGDYESDRRRLARQTERLDNSRRALLHILQDAHRTNIRLEDSRKAMIHIMGDLRDTTEEIQQREQELRDKQEQLVQAGKLATLGELTTGVAHELNNPLNNIGLFLGNVSDQVELGSADRAQIISDLARAQQQVNKASEIIAHLRTFGRVAPITQEPVLVSDVIHRARSLVAEQIRLRQIQVELDLDPADPSIFGNAIQVEQVIINLLTNARDAVAYRPVRRICIGSRADGGRVRITVQDSGPGIAPGLEQRIFDPFFTTKEVGQGTGLGLSITYGIIKEHQGEISVENTPGSGACFTLTFPRFVPGQEAAS